MEVNTPMWGRLQTYKLRPYNEYLKEMQMSSKCIKWSSGGSYNEFHVRMWVADSKAICKRLKYLFLMDISYLLVGRIFSLNLNITLDYRSFRKQDKVLTMFIRAPYWTRCNRDEAKSLQRDHKRSSPRLSR